MSKIGVGFIGCGTIAKAHAHCLKRISDAEIIAVYSRTVTSGMAFAREIGARYCGSLDSLLKDPKIDCVYILTRHDSHPEIARRSSEYGKDIFCEKPMALSVEEAKSICDSVERSGVRLMVGFNYRRCPSALKTRSLIEQGGLVPWATMSRFSAPNFLGSWAGLPQQGGGVLPCIGSHALDLLGYIVGSGVREIGCLVGRLRLSSPYLEDTASMSVRFNNDVLGSVLVHDHTTSNFSLSPNFNTFRVEVYGENKVIITTLSELEFLEEKNTNATRFDVSDDLCLRGFMNENQYFIQCLLTGEAPTPSEKEGLEIVRVMEAAQESARTGKVVRLSMFKT